jgi:hypothetical protein
MTARPQKSVSVSRATFARMAAYAEANDTTIANVLCDACGIPRQPLGRRPTPIEVPDWMFALLGKTAVTRRKRLDRAVRKALDAAGAKP